MRKINTATKIALAFICFYRRFISPCILPVCRFTPSCSEYAQEAFRTHGFISGAIFSLFRLLRCNPFCRSGFDPVPDKPFFRLIHSKIKIAKHK